MVFDAKRLTPPAKAKTQTDEHPTLRLTRVVVQVSLTETRRLVEIIASQERAEPLSRVEIDDPLCGDPDTSDAVATIRCLEKSHRVVVTGGRRAAGQAQSNSQTCRCNGSHADPPLIFTQTDSQNTQPRPKTIEFQIVWFETDQSSYPRNAKVLRLSLRYASIADLSARQCSIFQFNTEVTDGAAHLCVPEQLLSGAQIACLLVNLRNFRPTHRMRPICVRYWPTMRPYFKAGRSARMAGKFGVSLTVLAIRQACPQRHPDVDKNTISQGAAPAPRLAESPFFRCCG